MADRQLEDGSIERTDARTGRKRIVSAADAARTTLTRERDAEFSLNTGAPPIAKGPPTFAAAQSPAAPAAGRYQTSDRDLNVARAKADGQFDSLRTGFNAANKDRQMDAAGTILPSAPAAPAPAAPPATAPAAPITPGPVNATPEMLATPGAVPPERARMAARDGRPVAPAQPPTFDTQSGGFGSIAAAAGPNISTENTGLPEGSAGYARKGGGYTVRTADGQTRDFADEAAARAAFTQAAAPAPAVASAPALPPPPSIPRMDAAPDAASQAWAENSAGRFAAQDTSRAPAPAPTFAAMQSEAVPVAPVAPAPVSPELQAVVAAATAAPRPVATPTNTPAPQLRTGAGQVADVGAAFTAPFKAVASVVDSARVTPEKAATAETARKERQAMRRGVPLNLRDDRGRPVDASVPRDSLSPDRDASSVQPPRFDDEEPGAFPTLPGSVGSSRPRASFA